MKWTIITLVTLVLVVGLATAWLATTYLAEQKKCESLGGQYYRGLCLDTIDIGG